MARGKLARCIVRPVRCSSKLYNLLPHFENMPYSYNPSFTRQELPLKEWGQYYTHTFRLNNENLVTGLQETN